MVTLTLSPCGLFRATILADLPLATLQKSHRFIRQAKRQGLERLGWPGGYALAQLLLGDSGEDLGTTLC